MSEERYALSRRQAVKGIGTAGLAAAAPVPSLKGQIMDIPEDNWSGGLPIEADLMLAEPPPAPFDWVRESTSIWYYEQNGAFAIPRMGIEAEPWSWEDRRIGGSLAFADGRALRSMGTGKIRPVLDENGNRTVLGGGPITFRCIEPFRKWHVLFDGEMIDTTVADQIAGTVDTGRLTPVRYELEVEMATPADPQDISPGRFSKLGKGQQRDAVSIGLGWRFVQHLRGEGELRIDGRTYPFPGTGLRVKRRSVRTDGLMLRGHVWQGAVFPDGRAFDFETRPVHAEGFQPWNEGYIHLGGKRYLATVENPKWLGNLIPEGEDVSFDLRSELGLTRISGTTRLSTFAASSDALWGLNLHQGGVLYEWDGQQAHGMIERSMPTNNLVEHNKRA